MALHINAQNDLNEMFDKFATMPKERDKQVNTPMTDDPKKKADQAAAKGDTEPKTTK